MKKTVSAIIAGLMALCSYAQTSYDALLFSENEYEGTARTMAMGNAFTALGGDLGSIGLNPAGSAVAGYSQVTLTPGITIASSSAQGVPPYQGQSLPYFQQEMKSSMTKFNMPNVGATINFDTDRRSGLRNVTIGFIANKTASFENDVYAKGTNNSTSFMGSMAYWATYNGLTGADLNAEDAFDYMPWYEVIGYQSGMISSYGENDNYFVGASETLYDNGDVELSGPLYQSFGKSVTGGKYDFLLNVGFNFSDIVYIGANFGMTSLEFSYSEYFKETSIDPYDFEIEYYDYNTQTSDITYFNNMKYIYEYDAKGFGYYGKFGVIVTPGLGLRIGAAIQTPTLTNIKDRLGEEGETTYLNSRYDAYSQSPYSESSFTLISPYRANFGLAYTIGKVGVISADYEICDYNTMKFKANGNDRDFFESINEEIRSLFKASHSLRIGAEFKPLEELAIRAGYGMTTNPEIFNGGMNIKTQNFSFGLGYSSNRSFFADLAVRMTSANEYIMPYSEYIYEVDSNNQIAVDKNGNWIVAEGYEVPYILNKRNLWKVALTLGWRF